jgi:hypothetical protein
LQDAKTGVGSTLRKARLVRGVSLDEASRDTRIRPDSLTALEEEDFGALLGDVYVRGAIRSYATYLGLDPSDLVTKYSRAVGEPQRLQPPVRQRSRGVGERRLGSHRLAFLVAGVALAAAAAFGVISTRESAPPPSPLESAPPAAQASAAPPLDLTMIAHARVQAVVVVDGGEPEAHGLQPEEQVHYVATDSIRVRLARGSLVEITVNGEPLGSPGKPDKAYRRTFRVTAGP